MEKPRKKIQEGIVVSDKMEKTIVVAVTRKTVHKLYHKSLKRTSKFKVHDPENKFKTGDKVRIIETRPLSKDKRWRVLELLGAVKEKLENEDKGRPAFLRTKKEELVEAEIKEGESVES